MDEQNPRADYSGELNPLFWGLETDCQGVDLVLQGQKPCGWAPAKRRVKSAWT